MKSDYADAAVKSVMKYETFILLVSLAKSCFSACVCVCVYSDSTQFKQIFTQWTVTPAQLSMMKGWGQARLTPEGLFLVHEAED